MTTDMPSPDDYATRGDILGVESQISALQESIDTIGSVSDGLRQVGATVAALMTNLELAMAAQQAAEDARREDAAENKRRFLVTIGGIILANIIVVAISLVVLFGQFDARDQADRRSQINRDRQSCATSLLVEFDEKLGEALKVTTTIPQPAPDSPEFRKAVSDLNAATALVGRARELCYGDHPNPDPVPK